MNHIFFLEVYFLGLVVLKGEFTEPMFLVDVSSSKGVISMGFNALDRLQNMW